VLEALEKANAEGGTRPPRCHRDLPLLQPHASTADAQ